MTGREGFAIPIRTANESGTNPLPTPALDPRPKRRLDRGMKGFLFALFAGLFMVGCGESDLSDPDVVKDAIADAVEYDDLEDRDGVTYLPNTDKPFSGYAKRAYENEQVEILARLKDGYVVRFKQWQENGTPRWDVGYMEGKVGIEGMPYKRRQPPIIRDRPAHGPVTLWYWNGQKVEEGNYKDGKLDGLYTSWYSNGQKAGEGSYKDGKLMSTVHWKPNGEKCPVTNVKDGNGVAVGYNEDGTEWGRHTYKDGE